jgi:hypothetical protein
MTAATAADTMKRWPEESREAAQLVIDEYGEPDEVTDTQFIWHKPGPWKRIVATKSFFEHRFPAKHHDSVESFIDYQVPPERFSDLAAFDGSVIVERTVGEVSARCHDEQANFLALNLMHDIVTGAKTVDEARRYYGTEFLDARRNQPTPYMDGLRFRPPVGETADLDRPILSDEQLEAAKKEGASG